jgi:uncharacterized protein
VARAVAEGVVVAVVSRRLLDELTGVLMRARFRRWFSVADASAFVEALRDYGDLRDDPGPSSQAVRDPDDDYLVALAEAADAVVVTGDDDLLHAGLTPRAITPRDLLERLA